MMDTPLPIEFLAALRVAETGLTARELAEMDMDSYARVTNRQTPTQAAIQALEAQRGATAYQTSQQAPAPVQTPDVVPPQPDVAAMDWAAYAQWREASGLAARSDENMSHASVSMRDRWLRPTVAPSGRTGYYSGQ